ncbi:magnesium transporter, partial [Myxococcota bacterium]|nr:magnesium transporter [Myxococcota bacterium]
TDNRMLGVVTVDDVIEVIREEATEDIFKMAGAGDDIEYFQEPILNGLKPRLTKLIIPLLGGLLSVLLLTLRGPTFFAGSLLLLFVIPVLLLLSHNVATQTSTLVVRGFSMGRISSSHFGKILRREMLMGLLLGSLLGLVVFGVSFIPVFANYSVLPPVKMALMAGGVTVMSLIIATTVGAFLPLFYERLQLDPASAAGATVLTVVNILTIIAVLGASWIAVTL